MTTCFNLYNKKITEMKQVYHSNATTNIRLREEISKSKLPNSVLALQYGVSTKTVSKWKGRDVFKDKSSKPLL